MNALNNANYTPSFYTYEKSLVIDLSGDDPGDGKIIGDSPQASRAENTTDSNSKPQITRSKGFLKIYAPKGDSYGLAHKERLVWRHAFGNAPSEHLQYRKRSTVRRTNSGSTSTPRQINPTTQQKQENTPTSNHKKQKMEKIRAKMAITNYID